MKKAIETTDQAYFKSLFSLLLHYIHTAIELSVHSISAIVTCLRFMVCSVLSQVFLSYMTHVRKHYCRN